MSDTDPRQEQTEPLFLADADQRENEAVGVASFLLSLRSRGIRDIHILRAMELVPRDVFAPRRFSDLSRTDVSLPLPCGQTMTAPGTVAAMLVALGVGPEHRVLEIGTGSGYNAALLSMLAGPTGSVTSIDIDPVVTAAARLRLGLTASGAHAGQARETGSGAGPALAGGDLSLAPIAVLDADGWLGWPAGAPYDRIEATVGVWDLSPHWLGQLREGGMLVVPLWLSPGVEALVAFERHGSRLVSRTVDRCGFMRLRGPHAGPERHLRVGEWFAVLERPSRKDCEMLADLLRRPLAEEPLRDDLPRGWFARLSFDEQDAITHSTSLRSTSTRSQPAPPTPARLAWRPMRRQPPPTPNRSPPTAARPAARRQPPLSCHGRASP
jgi:protein-L-isoaspartate(D-aspartate) O-methyltransferase